MTTDNFCFYLQNRLIKPDKQEANGTVILPPLVFPGQIDNQRGGQRDTHGQMDLRETNKQLERLGEFTNSLLKSIFEAFSFN